MRSLKPSESTRRKLRVTFSVIYFTVCALVVALWIPSYHWRAQVVGGIRTHHVFATSLDGRLRLSISLRSGGWPEGTGFHWLRLSKDDNGGWIQRPSSTLGFEAWVSKRGKLGLTAPHWFVILIAAVAGAALWKRPWRFSLRAILVAMTLIATTLGVAVYLAR